MGAAEALCQPRERFRYRGCAVFGVDDLYSRVPPTGTLALALEEIRRASMCRLGATESQSAPMPQLRLVHGLIRASEQVRGIFDPVPCSRTKGAEDALRQIVAKTSDEATNAEFVRARRKDAELVATHSSDEVPT